MKKQKKSGWVDYPFKDNNQKERIQRFPRPKGLTQECISIFGEDPESESSTAQPQKQEKIQNQINNQLTEWIRNGNKFCGELYSVEDISFFLNISTRKTLRFINKLGKETEEDRDWVDEVMDSQENTDKLFSREGMLRVASAVASNTLFAATDSLNQAKDQLIHMENYRKRYSRFNDKLFEQINKGQANLNNATRTLTDLLKTLLSTLTVSTVDSLFSNIAYGKTQTFTLEQALELLNSKTSNPLDPAFLKASIESNGVQIKGKQLVLPENLPSVSALDFSKDNSGKQIITELRLQQNEIDNHLADRRIQDAEIL